MLGLALLTACPEDDGEPLECYDVSNSTNSVDAPVCAFPKPCDEVRYAESASCEVSATYDPAAGACVVEALRSGEPAELLIRDCPGGQFAERLRLQTFGDGTVLWDEAAFLDIGGDGRATWRALPDAAHFDACSTDTIDALLACLDAILAEACQPGEPSCG